MRIFILLVILPLLAFTVYARPDIIMEGFNNSLVPKRTINIESDMIQKYCSQVNTSVISLIITSMLIWIIEPKLRNIKIEPKGNHWDEIINRNTIVFMAKWIGLGLLFMAGYSIWTMR